MRPRNLAVLFLVVVGLLAFIWFYEGDLPSSDERAELAKRVLGLETTEVRGLTLGRDGAEVRFERVAAVEPDGEASWWLRQPLEAPADAAAVERLLEQLVGLEKGRTLEQIEPAELGLAEPRGRIRLETDAEPVELLIGSAVPASTTMILGLAGRDEAYVVADSLWRELEKPAGDWRSRDLGVGSRAAIERILLHGGGVALGRRGDLFWVEEPYVDRADRELVSALLGELVGLRVETFVDPPPSPAPELSAGAIDVVLTGREASFELEIGGPAGAEGELRLARVDGQLVEIRTELATALGRDPEEWRSRSWASLEVYEVDRLEVRDASGESVFERDGGEWLRDGARVRYEPVSDLLYALAGIEADSVAGGVEPAGEPLMTIVSSGADGERQETLRLYPPGEDGASAARVDGRDVTLLLGEAAVADLELKLAEARSAAEPEPPAGEGEPSEDGR